MDIAIRLAEKMTTSFHILRFMFAAQPDTPCDVLVFKSGGVRTFFPVSDRSRDFYSNHLNRGLVEYFGYTVCDTERARTHIEDLKAQQFKLADGKTYGQLL